MMVRKSVLGWKPQMQCRKSCYGGATHLERGCSENLQINDRWYIKDTLERLETEMEEDSGECSQSRAFKPNRCEKRFWVLLRRRNALTYLLQSE